MERIKKTPTLLHAILIGVLGVFSILLQPGLFVIPGLFAYVLFAGGIAPYSAAVVVFGAGAWVLSGSGGLYLLAFIMLFSLILFAMLKRKMSYFDEALLLAAFTTTALYVATNLNDILAGNPAFFTLQQQFGDTWQQISTSMGDLPVLDAAQWQQMQQEMPRMIRMLPSMMPAVLCGAGAFAGLTNLFCCVYATKRAGVAIKPMRPFMLWQLPKSFIRGILMIAAGLLVLYFFKLDAYMAIVMAAAVVAALPFAVQGLSLCWFVRQGRSLLTAMLIILLVLTFPASILTLAIMGILEQFMQIRNRVRSGGRKP